MPTIFPSTSSPTVSPCRRELRFEHSFTDFTPNSTSNCCESSLTNDANSTTGASRFDPDEELRDLRQRLSQTISSDRSRLAQSACNYMELMKLTADDSSLLQLPDYYTRQPVQVKSTMAALRTNDGMIRHTLHRYDASHEECGRPRTKKRKLQSMEKVALGTSSRTSPNQFISSNNSWQSSNQSATSSSSQSDANINRYYRGCCHKQFNAEVVTVDMGTF